MKKSIVKPMVLSFWLAVMLLLLFKVAPNLSLVVMLFGIVLVIIG